MKHVCPLIAWNISPGLGYAASRCMIWLYPKASIPIRQRHKVDSGLVSPDRHQTTTCNPADMEFIMKSFTRILYFGLLLAAIAAMIGVGYYAGQHPHNDNSHLMQPTRAADHLDHMQPTRAADHLDHMDGDSPRKNLGVPDAPSYPAETIRAIARFAAWIWSSKAGGAHEQAAKVPYRCRLAAEAWECGL